MKEHERIENRKRRRFWSVRRINNTVAPSRAKSEETVLRSINVIEKQDKTVATSDQGPRYLAGSGAFNIKLLK